MCLPMFFKEEESNCAIFKNTRKTGLPDTATRLPIIQILINFWPVMAQEAPTRLPDLQVLVNFCQKHGYTHFQLNNGHNWPEINKNLETWQPCWRIWQPCFSGVFENCTV